MQNLLDAAATYLDTLGSREIVAFYWFLAQFLFMKRFSGLGSERASGAASSQSPSGVRSVQWRSSATRSIDETRFITGPVAAFPLNHEIPKSVSGDVDQMCSLRVGLYIGESPEKGRAGTVGRNVSSQGWGGIAQAARRLVRDAHLIYQASGGQFLPGQVRGERPTVYDFGRDCPSSPEIASFYSFECHFRTSQP
ncbi:MAG: hypothetical protein JO058_22035 [Alphaproteobacteria bacterium]|nr:hypothetical protein [Alphaproteobacteria bacterium]